MPEQCCDNLPDAQLQDVEVDHRALMNILSRYPGIFDVLRELIQNADDANARDIEIHFQSGQATEKIDIATVKALKWIIKNNGDAFTQKDWERLGRIAYGNDDSTKVGAFGVGFYSVLSKSDRPLVKSNGKSLEFIRGDDGKLRKRFSECPLDHPWTSVELVLRDPEPLPVFADLARFLVSSVAFLTNIESVSAYLDGRKVLRIQRDSSRPKGVITIPPHLARTTPSQTLTVESVHHIAERIVIEAEEQAFAASLVSSALADTPDAVPERPSATGGDNHLIHTSQTAHASEENAITFELYTTEVSVHVAPESEMGKGVESSIKSLPPTFKCKALYFNSQQYNSLASVNLQSPNWVRHLAHVSGSQGIFSASNNGRLFIGQSTNQTTGIGLHLSGHFLSTMERGSIDLANGQVAVWNKEVLWIGGFLARIVYEEEMHNALQSKDGLATQLGLYTMNRFSFGPTSPHSGVSEILEDAFFSCCQPKSSSIFPVVSDTGISCLSKSLFRRANKELSFVKNCRVLHEKVESRQLFQIINRFKIPKFQYADVVREFEAGVPPDTLRVFFEWWEGVSKNVSGKESANNSREAFCKKFSSRGRICSTHGPQVDILLKKIKYFTFLPLPDDLSSSDTIRIEVPSGVPTKKNVECFGWTQLSLLHWLRLCTEAQLSTQGSSGRDQEKDSRILRSLVLFALVENLSSEQWEEVAKLMKNLECIPTSSGRKTPENSYFEQANIVGDLPVVDEITFLDLPAAQLATEKGFDLRQVTPEHVRKVLSRIGVRAMMGWEDMIGRLETVASMESNERLLRYVAYFPNWEKLLSAPARLDDLKRKKIFYSTNHGRLSAAELYLPTDDIRKLGLPILALPPHNIIDELQSGISTQFATQLVLKYLEIRDYPHLDKLISLAASGKTEIRWMALQYLLSNLETADYKDYKVDNFTRIAFIPTECGSHACPNEVLGSAVWKELGFKQVSKTLRRDFLRLGIKEDPSIDTIIEYLKTPDCTLTDIPTASKWFGHLYRHGNFPTSKLREQLSTMRFVPVMKAGCSSLSGPLDYVSPKECFIGTDNTKKHYRDIFPFVDFGPDGNNFLDSCCAKKLPDASDIVRKMMQDPSEYLKALQKDTDIYLGDLRTIALQLDSISEDDKQAMKKSPIFLASKGGVTELLRADQVVIGDWESRDFGDIVFVAPKDDMLEKMYCAMGSSFLGTFVQFNITPTGPKTNCSPPFTSEQVIYRLRRFMDRRDANKKADVLFYDEGSRVGLWVQTCKAIMLKKTFIPTCRISPPSEGTRETIPVHITAGLKLDENGELCTLWMAEGASGSDLHNGLAVALCHALLKTYGPDDVFLLSSLFATDDKGIEDYYGNKAKHEPIHIPNPKAKSKGIKVDLPPFFARAVGFVGIALKPGMRPIGNGTVPLEKAVGTVMDLWLKDLGDHTPDFSLPSRPIPSIKNHIGHCKQAHTIRLKEDKEFFDSETGIKFFRAKDACRQPSKSAFQEFARLVSSLAQVFGQTKASDTCFIFWKDKDEDLMAFNRDQKYIFLNLAHYEMSGACDGLDKKVITEWYLIMAHEIAHIMTLEHDEYHGSLTSRIVATYLSDLHKHKHFASVFS